MGDKKLIAALMIILLISSAVLLALFTASPRITTVASPTALSIHPKNLTNPLTGVPYVSQETDFFCPYASMTMIFKYFGIQTSLQEVLYYSGVGYSLVHQDGVPLPQGGYILSQSPTDSEFLASLYGLSFHIWYSYNKNLSDNQAWNIYWSYVKQNISNGTPVSTSVDTFKLSSIRQQFNIPEDVWDALPPGGHSIVIVGYNESNNTVCYNDPAAALFGNAKYGTYAWMNLDDFRKAVSNTAAGTYLVETFKKISEPLQKNEAFKKAHTRNIERLKGNRSSYDTIWSQAQVLQFGVNASKALNRDLTRGIRHRFSTIIVYKIQGMQSKKQYRHERITAFFLKIPSSFYTKVLHAAENVYYGRIAIEKHYTMEYLKNQNTTLGNSHEATLFEQEEKDWSILSSSYDMFLKRGFFMSLPRAILLIQHMEQTLRDIISVEEAIIANSD